MIRKGELADVPAIISIAKQSWEVTYRNILSDEQFDYMLNKFYAEEVISEPIVNKVQHYLLFVHNDQTIGFVSYEFKEQYCKIHKLYLLPESKGMGIGKKLINVVKDAALEANLDFIRLNVNKYNSALDFYKKIGMEIYKDEVIDIGAGYVMDDYVMSMSVK